MTEPDRLSSYEQLLQPRADLTMDVAIGIHTDIVTGIRFSKTGSPSSSGRSHLR
jgi:hypothetical protein